LQPDRQAEGSERGADQDGELRHFAKVTTELLEEQEDAGRQH